VVEDASRKIKIAPSAIYAAGFSNGGFLASTLPSASRIHWAGLSMAVKANSNRAMMHPVSDLQLV